MRTLPPYLCLCLLLVLASPARLIADPIVIDFEGLQDGTILSNQYSGVTFSNAIILTAGISLNEFEFPPLSGTNVASDNGGAMSIDFSASVLGFGGHFTYSEALALQAFNARRRLAGRWCRSRRRSGLRKRWCRCG